VRYLDIHEDHQLDEAQFAAWVKQAGQLPAERMGAARVRLEAPVAKRKKKQLPKDFETLLETRDAEDLKILFNTHDVNARGGFCKQTALAFHQCPDELARWLVEHGADIAAVDRFGDTPLHSRSRHWNGRIEVLLELGADVNHGDGENMHGTPLHAAAGSYQVVTAGLLLRHGARVDALNRDRHGKSKTS
jgi:ankyrin repeat protein